MSRSSPPAKRLARLLLATLLWASLIQVASASIFSDPVLSYCKCICFQNSTIIPLFRPTDPSKPCLSCTRQFCLDQKLGICKDAQVPELDTDVGTGTEGDVEARCFKRDSPRDQLIVTFFLLIVMGLLLFAAIRSRLRKAIEERGRPTDMREWGQALLPGTLHPILDKVPGTSRRSRGGSGGFGDNDMRDGSGGRYAPVSVGS